MPPTFGFAFFERSPPAKSKPGTRVHFFWVVVVVVVVASSAAG